MFMKKNTLPSICYSVVFTLSPGIVFAETYTVDPFATSESNIRALSSDASTVVGETGRPPRAFRWTEATGAIDPGTFKQDNSGVASAFSVDAAGDVVVGYAVNDRNEDRAFRWSRGTGSLEDLGTLKTDNSGRSLMACLVMAT